MKNIEVEFKFPLKNPTELAQKLGLSAQKKEKEQFQKDVYYILSH